MKLLTLAAVFSLVTATYAAQTTTASTQSTTGLRSMLDTLRESPFGLSYSLIGASARKEGNITGLNLYHDFVASYQATEKDKFSIISEFSNDFSSGKFNSKGNAYEITDVSYFRSKLMTQEATGVDVAFRQSYTWNNDQSLNHGTSSTRLYINRSLRPDLALNNAIRWDIVDNASGYTGGEARTKTLFRLESAPTYTISDQLSAKVTLRYNYRTKDSGANRISSGLTAMPGISYALSDNQSWWTTATVPVMTSTDNRIFAKSPENSISYELGYSFSAF